MDVKGNCPPNAGTGGGRERGDCTKERLLHKTIRDSVKSDEAKWIDDMLADGAWTAVRRLRKPPAPKQGRLRDETGELVSSDQRANTMAKHLETVQWH